MQKNGFNSLFVVGKLAHFIGLMLVFNFFFGLLFFGFFRWILYGMILLGFFLGTLVLGKNILFRPFETSRKEYAEQNRQTYNYADFGTTNSEEDIIDVEAEVVDGNNT